MTTKEKLLSLLENSRGTYLSGETIGQNLKLSRAAVWKAVNGLRNDGYDIQAVNNRGYLLSGKADVVSASGIQRYLCGDCLQIEVMDSVISTSSLVREKANHGAPHGYLLIANAQSAGRGRSGRSFFSPKDTGVYFSLLLRPQNFPSAKGLQLTTIAAVALCEAIRTVLQLETGIKWVNDIYVGGRKVCGILTEASFDMESGLMEYAVIGAGINVYPPADGFPAELADIAGWLSEAPMSNLKNQLIAAFIRYLHKYLHEESELYIEKYRKYSLVIGKEITVLSADLERRAKVLEIDRCCRLKVQYEDGTTAALSSGEIRIRL